MKIERIDHITIVVSDLERSLRFYSELLGFNELKRAHIEGEWVESIVKIEGVVADVVYIIAPGGEPRIELLCYQNPRGEALNPNSLPITIGLRHLAFKVDNIQNMYNKLKAAGVKFLSEPITVPTSVITHDEGHKLLCYFHDPDGILLEITEYKKINY